MSTALGVPESEKRFPGHSRNMLYLLFPFATLLHEP